MSVADVVFLLYILVYVYNMLYYYRLARRSWEKFDVVHTAPVTRISLGIESHGAFAIGDLNCCQFPLAPRCANWNVHAHFRSAEIRGQDLILGLSASGLHHLVYEIVDNSVDEHLAGACSQIRVTLEADGSCTVRDNGRGIPVEMHKKGVAAERIGALDLARGRQV